MRRNFVTTIVLVALIGGSGQALSAQQKVASDLLRTVGATPGQCVDVLSRRDYAALAAEDRAGKLMCGKYTGSISHARANCEAKYNADGLQWTSSRNHLQGTFKKDGYNYIISMTCMGKHFIVRISKANP